MVSYNSITGQCTHIILHYYVPAVIESSHPQGHWCLMREEIGLFFTVMNGRVPVIIMLCRISYFPQVAKRWCTHFPHQLYGGHLFSPVYGFSSYSLKFHKSFSKWVGTETIKTSKQSFVDVSYCDEADWTHRKSNFYCVTSRQAIVWWVRTGVKGQHEVQDSAVRLFTFSFWDFCHPVVSSGTVPSS